MDLKSKTLADTKGTDLTAGLENADLSPDKITVAYTRDNNLYVKTNGVEKAVSSDGNEGLTYGAANVHRNEFGIGKGTFFSPRGKYLAFYRMDQSMVTDYPFIDWSKKPALNQNVKYPFAGDKSHHVTLGIYELATGKTHYVKTTGDPEQYLTNIAWNEEETKVYIAIVNRAQNEMKLNEYDAVTGNFLKTLFEEKDQKYVEPLHPLMVVKNNPSQFIWHSNRDGYMHLYLYDFNGKPVKQLTSGKWEIKQVNGFDAKGENLFFHANVSSPVNQDFCMVNVKTGVLKVLTKGDGFHVCTLDHKAGYFTDNFSNVTTPRIVSLVNISTGKSTELYRAKDPLTEYRTGKLKLFTIKNNQGTDLYCRMFYPADFDSTKKYPVVVYLYNGPHVQLVTNSWQAGVSDLWPRYMGQKGFIVFTLDGRGSENRGKDFEQAIFRQCGTAEMEDQLCGVNYLKSLRYVDPARLGVHGWSYGGFMTTSLMTRNAGVFKAAVAGGPVIDWSYYEVMYTERYMDTPQENPDGYTGNSLLNHIDKLKGKLLVIHGTDDDVVVWQQSLMLLRKSVEKGVQLDYYVYPGHKHNVLGKDRAHLMEKVTEYFEEHL
jgi:dipeptidyl-peptidase-4